MLYCLYSLVFYAFREPLECSNSAYQTFMSIYEDFVKIQFLIQ